MGNNPTKHQTRDQRPKKNVHWKSAEPPAPPGKPILVPIIDSTPDVIRLRWERPRNDGGSPIIGYLVEHRRTGSPHWVRATPTLIPYPELTLSGLEPGWRYQFRVTAENIVGQSESSELSDPLTVTLQRNAITPPRFLHELQDMVATENEKIEFNVNVVGQPPPQINWFKDGFEIFSSRRTKIINENNTSTLIIHQAALVDEGEIKCTATNRAGHVVTRATLILEALPKIRLPRQYEDGLIIEADETIRLKVGVAGRPTPRIIWYHNGETIPNSGRYEIISNEKNSSLRINHAIRNDRGEYNIKALNKLGEDSASFLVTITAKPNPPGKVIITRAQGRSVTLTWTSPEDDGGCNIGNYIVEYFRIGWNVWLKAVSSRQLFATFSDLIEGSEYKFRVKAENPYGLSDPSPESETLFIPDIKRGIIVKPLSADNISNIKPFSLPRTKTDSSKTMSVKSGFALKIDKQEQTVSRHRHSSPSLQAKRLPEIYDSETIARELNYGTSADVFSVKLELKKEESRNNIQLASEMDYELSESIIPVKRSSPLKVIGSSSKPVNYTPKPEHISFKPINEETVLRKIENGGKKDRQMSKDSRQNCLQLETPRSDTDEVHTSSEFMLVIYEDEKRESKPGDHSIELDLEESLMPPPISLSAPDLSAEPPPIPILRRTASSTELLYEKAMARFYQAVQLEEEEEKKATRGRNVGSSDVNTSKNVASENNTLERTESSSKYFNKHELAENSEYTPAAKPKFYLAEDNEEKLTYIERVPKQNSKDLTPSSSIDYDEDYTDSTESSGSIDSMEKFKIAVQLTKTKKYVDDNELETYHPRMDQQYMSGFQIDDNQKTGTNQTRDVLVDSSKDYEVLKRQINIDFEGDFDKEAKEEGNTIERKSLCDIESKNSSRLEPRTLSPYRMPEPEHSTVHLTKPLPLPHPDFVPKPILKRPSLGNSPNNQKEHNSNKNSDSSNGSNGRDKENENEKEKENKETRVKKDKNDENKKEKPNSPKKSERKGFLQIFERKKTSSGDNKIEEEDKPIKRVSAAEIERRKTLELRRQSSIEETKVVVDHYSDLVRELGSRRTPKIPIYLNSEELKKAAEKAEEEERLFQTSNHADEHVEEKEETVEISDYFGPSNYLFSSKCSNTNEQHTTQNYQPIEPIAIDQNRSIQQIKDVKQNVISVDDITRGRSSKTETTVQSKNTSGTRSRSSSAIKVTPNKKEENLLSSNKPSIVTRTQLKNRNKSESKSPAARNRNTLKVITMPMAEYNRQKMKLSPSVSPEPRSLTPEQIIEEAEQTVKSTLNYVTDVAMFIIACWLYMFKDARLAIPILALMVYRQVGDAIKDKLPKWILKKDDK